MGSVCVSIYSGCGGHHGPRNWLMDAHQLIAIRIARVQRVQRENQQSDNDKHRWSPVTLAQSVYGDVYLSAQKLSLSTDSSFFFCFCSTTHVRLLICVVSSGNPGWSNTYPMSNVDNYAIFGWASLLGVMAVVCCGGFDVLLPRKGLNGPNPQFVLPEFRGLITLAAKTVHI